MNVKAIVKHIGINRPRPLKTFLVKVGVSIFKVISLSAKTLALKKL